MATSQVREDGPMGTLACRSLIDKQSFSPVIRSRMRRLKKDIRWSRRKGKESETSSFFRQSAVNSPHTAASISLVVRTKGSRISSTVFGLYKPHQGASF